MQGEMTNYITIQRFSFRYRFYAFVDTAAYLADALFIKHKVTVKFLREYGKDGTAYRIIFCRIHKRDEAAFLAALHELPEEMLLCGNEDYEAFCQQLMEHFEKGKEEGVANG